MYYAEIKYNDIANGTGVRTSLFVSGCTHHCYNCFNQVAWNFKYGKEWNDEVAQQIIDSLAPEWIAGFTLLGGEPMEFVNQEGLAPFIEKVKAIYPNKTIWCFTGYLYEDLLEFGKMHGPYTDTMLKNIDVLVDGPYLDALHDVSLIFKGSSNQRTIDLQASLKEGKVILFPLEKGTI